jgi:hypothetical protein
MPTLELAEVREYIAQLEAKLPHCEPTEEAVQAYTQACIEIRDTIRSWGMAIFKGQLAFDASVEHLWQSTLRTLHDGAAKLLASFPDANLEIANKKIGEMVDHWVTPHLSVSPGARQGLRMLTPYQIEEARQRLLEATHPTNHWKVSASTLATVGD